MILTSDYQALLGVFLAFSATFFWRLLGLILAERISAIGLLMRWVNSVAYSMVAGIMMMIMVFPSGVMENTTLVSRLIGLAAGIIAIFLTKTLFAAIIASLFVFAIALYLGL